MPLATTQVDQPANTMAFQFSQADSRYGDEFGCDDDMIESDDWDVPLR